MGIHFNYDLPRLADNAGAIVCIGTIDLNPLAVERCLDSDSVSGVHVYDNMLALQLPVADDWEASQKACDESGCTSTQK